MTARLHFNAVRRRAAMCVALWAIAFFGCSVHCALAGNDSAAAAKAHACCAKQQSAKSDGAKTCCSAMPQVTAGDTAFAKVDFAPQLVALIAPLLSGGFAATPAIAAVLPRPDPDSGPPSHVPLMRLAGRAPPALA